jgi:hypothetical protein
VLITAQKASLLDSANYSTKGLTVATLTDCPVRLTPCSRLFLEKLTVAQLVNKWPAFYKAEGSLPPPVAIVSQLNHAHSLSLRSTSMIPIYALFFQVISLFQIPPPPQKSTHFCTPHIWHICNLLFLFIITTHSYPSDDRTVNVGFHMLLLLRTTTT